MKKKSGGAAAGQEINGQKITGQAEGTKNAAAGTASAQNPGGPQKWLGRPLFLQSAVQYLFLAFYIYVGLCFFFYVMWAIGYSNVFVSRPPSVEAFLPIGGLMSLKRLLLTGQYDPIHPAGLTILIMALVTSFFLRKGFCGYLCPVGAVSRLLERLGQRLGLQRQPPRWLSWLLTLPKYFLLAFFFYIVLWSMDVAAIEGFMQTPYYIVADSKMLLFFLRPTTFVLVALGVLALGSLLVPGFWCRGFCPYGAFLGLFSLFSPTAVTRDAETCIQCRACSRACPTRIAVHKKQRVNDPECLGCTRCVAACPVKGCLNLSVGYGKKTRRIPAWGLAAASLLVVLALFAWAWSTGHWDNNIPPEMQRMLHRDIQLFQHP